MNRAFRVLKFRSALQTLMDSLRSFGYEWELSVRDPASGEEWAINHATGDGFCKSSPRGERVEVTVTDDGAAA